MAKVKGKYHLCSPRIGRGRCGVRAATGMLVSIYVWPAIQAKHRCRRCEKEYKKVRGRQ